MAGNGRPASASATQKAAAPRGFSRVDYAHDFLHIPGSRRFRLIAGAESRSVEETDVHCDVIPAGYEKVDGRQAMTGTRVEDQLVAFLPNLRRFAISLCRSRELADDLVQTACERALANAASFQEGTRFDAWMFRILRNLWIDEARKQEDCRAAGGYRGAGRSRRRVRRARDGSAADAEERGRGDRRLVRGTARGAVASSASRSFPTRRRPRCSACRSAR